MNKRFASKKEQQQEYDKTHAKEISERMKRYYVENKEKRAAYQRQYNEEHREQKSEYDREWALRNNLKRRATNQRRRARKLEAGGTFTATDIERIYAEQNGLCSYCGIELHNQYHIDHVYPISRGGTSWPDNLACACQKCNLSKADNTVEEWLARLEKA